MINRALLIGLLWGASLGFGFGQSATDLAGEYYKNGEFDKAANEYARLLRRAGEEGGAPLWPTVYKYVTSLQRIKKSDEALRFLKKQSKADGTNRFYYEALTGFVLREQPDTARVTQAYEAALADVRSSPQKADKLAVAFTELAEPSWAIKAYENARTAAKDETRYSEELAALYKSTGVVDKWIDELLLLARQPAKRELVFNSLQPLINTKEEATLEKVLYDRMQKQPNELQYSELLSWFYVQKQKFGRALIQERAVDKRLKLGGARVYELGVMAMNNREFQAAVDAFEYVIATYPQGQFYPFARRMVINAREEQVKNTYPINKADIRRLISDYQQMLQQVGSTNKTLEALRSTANLYAYYLDEKDSALAALDLAVELSKNDRTFTDKCKLDKGDIYLLKNEPWEATLLYSQVEKSQKEEPLGYEAKLRNAKLHYYKGEFTLAKELLDILKLATSREIANDAGQLSLLILDNTGLDSSEAALREYAAIDLLLFQNKTDQAVAELNRMLTKHAGHSLADEILWLRANTYLKQGKADEALDDLRKLLAEYPTDILGDDAMFLLGKVLEERKKDKEAAMDTYQKFLTTYPGSIHTVEARRRFRVLRGDVIN